MNEFRKINEWEMLDRLKVGEALLRPLVIKSIERQVRTFNKSEADARLVLGVPEAGSETFTFILETKSRSVPQLVQEAIGQARRACGPEELPMIQIPYLSPEKIEELEREKVSGVDLCGNGIVIVPGRLLVMRTGQRNRFPETRPLNNPYRGRSAMVARTLMEQGFWDSLTSLAESVAARGTQLSLAQVSKAVQAMEEDRILAKDGGKIRVRDAQLLLDNLGSAWKGPKLGDRQAIRMPKGRSFVSIFSSSERLKWALTGSSSITRYTTFAQAGPQRVAVNNLALALELLDVRDSVPTNFADLELVETDEEGYFFANESSNDGTRYASLLQTWLELQAGDARQQDAAYELRSRLLSRAMP